MVNLFSFYRAMKKNCEPDSVLCWDVCMMLVNNNSNSPDMIDINYKLNTTTQITSSWLRSLPRAHHRNIARARTFHFNSNTNTERRTEAPACACCMMCGGNYSDKLLRKNHKTQSLTKCNKYDDHPVVEWIAHTGRARWFEEIHPRVTWEERKWILNLLLTCSWWVEKILKNTSKRFLSLLLSFMCVAWFWSQQFQ